MDAVLNVTFFGVHTLLILFNCLGWMWPRSRPWHLASLTMTAASWFVLGAWYGWGYCPCTDWHWQVRVRLGYADPPSYTQLMFRELTGVDPGTRTSDVVTACVFVLLVVLSISLNVRDWRQRRSV
jgi:Protein of Unknown function (DUF2784)